jgi:iron(III) transport system substrate-binding protein
VANRNLFLITALFVLVATSVTAQQLRPLAANDVEYLLQGSVTVKRLTDIVNESGVRFQLSNALKERFRKAGADASLLEAIERAGSKRKNRSKQEIIELAKKEAMVVWYSSIQSPLPEELCNRFNSKKVGITCVVHRSGSGNLYRQLVAESTGAVNKADIIHTSNLDDFVRLRQAGALLRYRPEGIEKFDSSFLEKNDHWTVMRAGLFVPAYNTNRIGKNDVPNSWLDFFDQKQSDIRLAMGDPFSSGFVNVGLAILVNQFGPGFLDKLAAQNPRVLQSAADATTQLRTGSTAILFGGISYAVYQEIINHHPIAYVHPKEGLPFIVSPQGILTDAPHPNAAMVFTDWLFTKEAQQILADKGHYVGHPDVTYPKDLTPLKNLKLMKQSPDTASATFQRVRDQFREKFSQARD